MSIDIYHSGEREVLSVIEQDFNYLTFYFDTVTVPEKKNQEDRYIGIVSI